MRFHEGPLHRSPRAPVAFAGISALILAAAALSPAAFAAAGGPRGPAVVVPECWIVGSGCGLDPNTPDLDSKGCMLTLAGLLERRGVTARPVAAGDICASDPGAVVLEAVITAACGDEKGDDTPRDFALATRLRADVVMRDCATGEVVGNGSTLRSLESGRKTILRDALEEMSHHLSESSIRRSHPGTPYRWFGADAGGWHSVEITGGLLDLEDSEINDAIEDLGLDREKRATRILLESSYNPYSHPRVRGGGGVELIELTADGRSAVTLSQLDDLRIGPGDSPGFDPNALFPVPRDVQVTLRVVGFKGSIGYGADITRNQRLSADLAAGYYALGTWLGRSRIEIDGVKPEAYRIRSGQWGLTAEIRWDWRITTHVGLIAAGGWNVLNFGHADRINRRAGLPFEVDFTGATARAGVGIRF